MYKYLSVLCFLFILDNQNSICLKNCFCKQAINKLIKRMTLSFKLYQIEIDKIVKIQLGITNNLIIKNYREFIGLVYQI